MKAYKIYRNHKFPEKSIEIQIQPVGGGVVVQYENSKPTQAIVLANKAFSIFLEEIENEGWKAA